jgi:glycosyltransferase 2 family protein
MSASPSFSRQDWRKIVPGVIISALSLVAIFYLVDLRRLIDALRLADYRFIFLLLVITLIWIVVRSIAWRTLLQERAPLSMVFLTLNQGYVLNNILPLRLGEVGRAFLLSRKAHLGFLQVFSTVLIERALDVALAAGVLLGTLPFVVGGGFAWQVAVLAGGLVLFGLLLLHLLARNQLRAQILYERWSQRLPALGKLLKPHQLEAAFEGLAVLVDGRRFLRVLFWMLLNWAIAILQFYVLMRAFFPEARLIWATLTLGVMAMGVAVPSSPGAVGVLEIAIIGALSVFGVDPSTALAAALTAHLTNYLVTGLIGAYAFLKDGLTLAGVFRDVRNISSSSSDAAG